MRPPYRHAALFLLLFGCASAPTLSAEYSLDPREHPEGIDCFYSCLKHLDRHERGTCLTFCGGVEVSVTSEPCAPGSPSLCRGYSIPEHELTDAAEMTTTEDGDGDGSVAGEILGGVFVGLIEAAICGGDCDEVEDDDCDENDDEDQDRRDYNHHRPRAERTRPRKESPPSRTERAPKPSSDRRGRPLK